MLTGFVKINIKTALIAIFVSPLFFILINFLMVFQIDLVNMLVFCGIDNLNKITCSNLGSSVQFSIQYWLFQAKNYYNQLNCVSSPFANSDISLNWITERSEQLFKNHCFAARVLKENTSQLCSTSLYSSEHLSHELDSYEWFTILKSELDSDVSIPVDLAVKYGKEYMGSIVKDKIRLNRNVFYAGVSQEISQLQPIGNSTFPINNNKIKKNEIYNDYSVDQFGINPSMVQAVNLSTNIGHYDLDDRSSGLVANNLSEQLVSSNYGYEAINTFLMWRDSVAADNTQKQQQTSTTLPDEVSPIRFSDYVEFSENLTLNPFYNLNTSGLTMMASTHSLLINQSNSVGMGQKTNALLTQSVDSDLTSLVTDEIIPLTHTLSASFADNIYSTIIRFNRLRVDNLSTYVGYLVLFLRNPLYDFSYAPLKSIHYNSLDKHWDSRPSTSALLGTDVTSLSAFSGFLIDSYTNKESLKVRSILTEKTSITPNFVGSVSAFDWSSPLNILSSDATTYGSTPTLLKSNAPGDLDNRSEKLPSKLQCRDTGGVGGNSVAKINSLINTKIMDLKLPLPIFILVRDLVKNDDQFIEKVNGWCMNPQIRPYHQCSTDLYYDVVVRTEKAPLLSNNILNINSLHSIDPRLTNRNKSTLISTGNIKTIINCSKKLTVFYLEILKSAQTVLNNVLFKVVSICSNSTSGVLGLTASVISQLKLILTPTHINYLRVELSTTKLISEVITNIFRDASFSIVDVYAAQMFVQSIPVFFTKSPLKYAIAEEPKFSILSYWIRILDAIEYIYDESLEMILEDFDGKGEFFIELNYFLPDFEEFFSEMFDEANDLLRIWRDSSVALATISYFSKIENRGQDINLTSEIFKTIFLIIIDSAVNFCQYTYEWNTAILRFYIIDNISLVLTIIDTPAINSILFPFDDNKISKVNIIRDFLNIPPLIDNFNLFRETDRLLNLDQRILSAFKFYSAPLNTPFIESNKFPSVGNSSFNDVKYLKNTNSLLRWYLTDDVLPWSSEKGLNPATIKYKNSLAEITMSGLLETSGSNYAVSTKKNKSLNSISNPTHNLNRDQLISVLALALTELKSELYGCDSGDLLPPNQLSETLEQRINDLLKTESGGQRTITFSELIECCLGIVIGDEEIDVGSDPHDVYELALNVGLDFFRIKVGSAVGFDSSIDVNELSLTGSYLILVNWPFDDSFHTFLLLDDDYEQLEEQKVDDDDEEEDDEDGDLAEFDEPDDDNHEIIDKRVELESDDEDLEFTFEKSWNINDNTINNVYAYTDEDDYTLSYSPNGTYIDFDKSWSYNRKRTVKSQKKLRYKQSKISRTVNDSEPWNILSGDSVKEIFISGTKNPSVVTPFNLDSNTQAALAYKVKNGKSIFEILADLVVGKSVGDNTDVLLNIFVEYDYLRFPWVDSNLPISKKLSYLKTSITSSGDLLLLDKISKMNSDESWVKQTSFGETFEQNIRSSKSQKIDVEPIDSEVGSIVDDSTVRLKSLAELESDVVDFSEQFIENNMSVNDKYGLLAKSIVNQFGKQSSDLPSPLTIFIDQYSENSEDFETKVANTEWVNDFGTFPGNMSEKLRDIFLETGVTLLFIKPDWSVRLTPFGESLEVDKLDSTIEKMYLVDLYKKK